MNYSYGSLKVKVCGVWQVERLVDELNEKGKIVVDVKPTNDNRTLVLYKEDYHNEERTVRKVCQ
jgi:hypothetical protein